MVVRYLLPAVPHTNTGLKMEPATGLTAVRVELIVANGNRWVSVI